MRIMISVDMEGISGISHWDHVTPGNSDYLSRYRRLMTQDVNAAIEGAYDGGATEVIVTDAHWYGSNILIEELDPRARLNIGLQSPLAMLQGLSRQIDGMVLIGYHAAAGTQNAVCDHTWSDVRVHQLKLNGQVFGEIGLNSAIAGHFEVPVLAISGDQAAVEEATLVVGKNLQTAVVKYATGQQSAECLSLETAHNQIRQAVHGGVKNKQLGRAPGPFSLSCPVDLEIRFRFTRYADRAALLPGSERIDGISVRYKTADIVEAYQVFRIMVAAARD